MVYKRARTAWTRAESGQDVVIANLDCINLLKAMPDASVSLVISSPPYCMGKEYETKKDLQDFIDAHAKILPEIARVTKPGGSVCWQVGYHVQKNTVMPLDYLVFDAMRAFKSELVLRNRIVWTFGHGFHCDKRFSGRHEVILWFTKGDNYDFDLDPVRVPQKYPGKRSHKGPNKGEHSGNPLGKNPSDIWEIPNVNSNHREKLAHPCQFPVALAQRLVLSLSKPGDLVFDPFSGVASAGVAAVIEGRRFLGAELDESYAQIAQERLTLAINGEVPVRPLDQKIYVPDEKSDVAKRPAHFWPNNVQM